MKDRAHQKKILDICDKVLDQPIDTRAQLLEELCAGDQDLQRDIKSMLERIAADEDSKANLTTSRDPLSLLQAKSESIKAGDIIDKFTVLEQIGSGGMGAVFRARRTDQHNEQQVAIKVLHAHILTPELRLRFNLERDILARLRHPYIAGLIDGGTTNDGTPYLAMELVDGERIDDFCDTQKLTINERLKLLAEVGHALQHAHQNLVVHRDIKPSNVLITPDGIPKLVDFGIAKLVGEEGGLKGQHGATTYFGSQALTPDFASPEQLLEGKVSTASDTYSLGILATLLLTGKRPYDVDFASPRAVVSAFQRTRTWRASSLLSGLHGKSELAAIAAARKTTPAKIRKRFQGDLDTVLAKATHTEPERRYVTVEAFAEDLTNHRKRLPVNARGDSLAYRTWALIRTNRLAFSVVGATMAALSIGLSAALWQARIANERFTDLHQFARIVLEDIYDSVVELPGSTPTRILIAEEAQHYLDKLVSDDINDEVLLADLSLAYRRVADVQGRPSSANLGESAKALENYSRAQDIAEQIANETPSMTRARAQIYRRKGELLAWQGDLQEAIQLLRRSKDILQGLFQASPEDERARVDLAYNLINLGDRAGHPTFTNLGNKQEASEMYDQAIELLANAASTSTNRELLRSYSVALERAGTMDLTANKLEAAQLHFEHSNTIRAKLADEHPEHLNIQRDAGIAIEQLAKVQLKRGDLGSAIANFEAALDVYLRLAKIDPGDASAARTVAVGRTNLGDALHVANRRRDAITQYQVAQESLNRLLAGDPGAPRLIKKLRDLKVKLADLQTQ